MSVPASYDAASLGATMLAWLGPVADVLGWQADADVEEALIATALALGVDDIADATDISELRAIARREVWQLATDALASRYDLSTDGQSLSRSQLYQQARGQLRLAAQRAARYQTVTRTTITRTSDPYAMQEVD